MTEHWCNSTEINNIVIEGYSVVTYFCRNIYKNGGTLIMKNNKINFDVSDIKNVSISSIEKIYEVCAVNIKIENTTLKLLTIYRSPTSDKKQIDEFLTCLDNTLSVLSKDINYKLILCGDLNIDYLSNSASKKELVDLLHSYNINMLINEPTRFDINYSNSCLDYFCSNIKENIRCKVSLSGLSDHTSQFCEYFTDKVVINQVPRYARHYSDINFKNFLAQLSKEQWNDVYDAVTLDDGFTCFINILKYYIDIHFPVKKISGTNSNTWVTQGIKISSQKLKDLNKLLNITKNPNIAEFYKKYKNIYRKVIRTAKRMYNDKLYSNANNKSKAVWDIINKNINNNTNNVNVIREMKINNTIERDSFNIAQYLNFNFIDKPKKLNQHISKSNNKTQQKSSNSIKGTLFLDPVTENEIFNIIMELKKSNSCGLDSITTNLLQKSVTFIVTPITYLVNFSIRMGIFPAVLKSTKIIPIHKKGDILLPENYRPIALLSSISKILEKVIYKKILCFCTKEKLFSKSQHGFLKGLSTETAIMNFLNTVFDNLEQNKKCIGIFMDLSKAFDLIDHKLLINKLEQYGLRGKISEWLTSYLSNRQQLVEVNGIRSEYVNVEIGVPQGSVLGPLLFILYINDLPENFDENTLTMYADDNSLIISNKSEPDLIISAQHFTNKCVDWYSYYKLFINISKTVFINFTPRSSSTQNSYLIKINGRSIEQVTTTKFLGIYIDCGLNWETHVTTLANKLSSICYALYRLKNIANMFTVMSYYYANFVSRVKYGIMFWGASSHFERVFKIQKKAVRIMTGATKYSSCRNLFRELKILTLACIYILEIVCYVKLNEKSFVPNDFNHDYNTRNAQGLCIPVHRLTSFELTPRYMGIKLYNRLPKDLRLIANSKLFRRKVNEFLLQKSYYNINEFLINE